MYHINIYQIYSIETNTKHTLIGTVLPFPLAICRMAVGCILGTLFQRATKRSTHNVEEIEMIIPKQAIDLRISGVILGLPVMSLMNQIRRFVRCNCLLLYQGVWCVVVLRCSQVSVFYVFCPLTRTPETGNPYGTNLASK